MATVLKVNFCIIVTSKNSDVSKLGSQPVHREIKFCQLNLGSQLKQQSNSKNEEKETQSKWPHGEERQRGPMATPPSHLPCPKWDKSLNQRSQVYTSEKCKCPSVALPTTDPSCFSPVPGSDLESYKNCEGSGKQVTLLAGVFPPPSMRFPGNCYFMESFP